MAEPIPLDPTAEDFRDWIRPSEALIYLASMGPQKAAREIYRRLCNGMLFAAGTPSSVPDSGLHDRRKVIIPPWWEAAPLVANPAADFWATAGATVQTKRQSMRESVRTYEFFGIRFEPNGLQRVADDAGIEVVISERVALAKAVANYKPKRVLPPYAASAAQKMDRPKRATKDELRQWFPTYERASQDFRFDTVMDAAKRHFHPRPVTRQPLRDVIGEFNRTQTRGKPSAFLNRRS